jgi:ribonuclease P/MRP protein subunit RPP40
MKDISVLGMQSLEMRRIRGELIETYKIITGKERVDSEVFFRQSETTSLKFFSQRVFNVWNHLPQSDVRAETTRAIKNQIDGMIYARHV